jgi:GH3 auxin-responsive promoter
MAARDLEDFRMGLSRPEALQEACLFDRVIRPNVDSEYGRRHGFSSIQSIREYRERVPIVRYADIEPEIERTARGEASVLVTEPVRRFFQTSGSSAAPKTIPVTSSFIGDKSRAFGLYWGMLFERHPDAHTGKVVGNFSDSGGSYTLPSGRQVSSEGSYWSKVGAATQKRGKSPLPKFIGAIADSSARYYTVARILAEENVSLFMALNPSTILLLFRKMNEHRDALIRDVERGGLSPDFPVSDEVRAHVSASYAGNPARARELRAHLDRGGELFAQNVWSGLRLVVSWRSPMQRPYLQLLEPHLGAVPQRDYILMASEGIIAIPHVDHRSGGLLATPIHFYEFVREHEADLPQPETLLAHELEVGKNYVVLLSTSAGLYRYNIGDVLHVSGIEGRTPIVEFLYRAGATSSITGEKLTEDQVVEAVTALSARLGLALEGFTLLPAKQGFPHYLLLAEFAARPGAETLSALPRALDAELEQRNIEYGAKRHSERLEAPEVWVIEPGGYAAIRERRIAEGANDAQIKPVRLTRNAEFADQFRVVERFHAH